MCEYRSRSPGVVSTRLTTIGGVPDNAVVEAQVLPGATQVGGVVDDAHPVLVVHRHLHVVRVGPQHAQPASANHYVL